MTELPFTGPKPLPRPARRYLARHDFGRQARAVVAIVAMIGSLLVAGLTGTARADERVAQDQNEQPGSFAAASISAGFGHTCVLLSSGAVRCWGQNDRGQLGLGNTIQIGDNENPTANVNLGGATPTAIALGTKHTCALLAGGAVRCWGLNSVGQLGLGNTNDIGDDETPSVNVNLGGATATAISVGGNTTCVLLTGGAVRCWGLNSLGQLGLGNTADIGDNESPTANVNLGGVTAIAVTTSGAHTCVVLFGGAVRCWGINSFGQLGLGNTTDIGDNELPTTNVNLGGATALTVSAGGNHTCALLSGEAVRCWGANGVGQLGLGNTNNVGDNENPTVNTALGARVVSLSTGDLHVCVRLLAGGVRCWGRSDVGQLGLGNTNSIGDDETPTVNVNLGVNALHVTAGQTHSCAVLTGGAVRCWGNNASGRLGIGNMTTIGDDEEPTVNVNLGGATVGIDTVAPTVTITSPSADQAFASSPIVITGVATDNAGVTSVGVAIYRNVNGGQYWNGTAFQAANTTVPATLASPGAATTTFTYSFTTLGGVYATAAVGLDAANHVGIADYRNFSRTDNTNPTVTLTSPLNNQVFATRPVALGGFASDNAGVGEVQVSIFRPVGVAGQFWNGTAWQDAYTTIIATLDSPGATFSTFSYSFDPPQSGGLFYAAAIVLDTSYRFNLTAFTPFTLPDAVNPAATITNPLNGATTSGAITVTGTASDNTAIGSVGIAIYQASSGQYWNGTNFQSGFRTVSATLSNPGDQNTTFTYTFTPPVPGFYLIGALPIDGKFNFTLTGFNTITAN